MKQPILFVLILTFLSPMHNFAEKHHIREFDTSFAHVVYFWLKNPDSEADRAKFEIAIKQFMEDSKYAKTSSVGIAPKATRDVVDDSFTYSLILSFESAEAQKKYQAEEAHTIFVDTCKDLWENVIVYDSVPLK